MPSPATSDALDRALHGELPWRFRDRALDSFEPRTPSQKRALVEARRMLSGEIQTLVLIGPPGVGKTHLAAAIFRALSDRVDAEYAEIQRQRIERFSGHERTSYLASGRYRLDLPAPRWQNMADLVTGLRFDMDRPADDRTWASRLQDDLRPAPVLVLDDLGREKASDWTGELVYGLVNARYENGQRTVATSNLAPAELEANGYWVAVSRLAEDGALVAIEAPDHRLAR